MVLIPFYVMDGTPPRVDHAYSKKQTGLRRRYRCDSRSHPEKTFVLSSSCHQAIKHATGRPQVAPRKNSTSARYQIPHRRFAIFLAALADENGDRPEWLAFRIDNPYSL
jgi:hypothetical protein